MPTLENAVLAQQRIQAVQHKMLFSEQVLGIQPGAGWRLQDFNWGRGR